MRTKKIFLFTVLCFLSVFAFIDAETPNNTGTDQLAKIEQEMQVIRQNQEKIEVKNNEIKTELANLRVWIHHR